jgi:hypothetical protein
MPTYKATIEVRKTYHVDVTADSAAEAVKVANGMTTLTLAEIGKCDNIETEVIEVEEDEDEQT